MDLSKELSPELWNAVQGRYERGSYADAILESMKALTKLIREKSAADGDGAALIGQAFGGSSPKIMLNRMQTTSEIDEQKGFEQLIRGLYVGIRNPRTHEMYNDSKDTAEAVIRFVDFLWRRISSTSSFFELDNFKKRVFDKMFVERDDYAQLIVSEIPYDELEATACAIFAERSQANPEKLQYFFKAVFDRADRDQKERILKTFSNELRKAKSESEIIDVIRYVQGELWALVDEDVKLRSEASMIESVKKGKVDVFRGGIQSGQLGTWATTRGEHFELSRELAAALIDLLAVSWYTQNYIGEYFFFHLHTIIKDDDQIRECCANLAYAAMRNKAVRIREKLETHFDYLPKHWRDLILEYSLRYKDEDPAYFAQLSRVNVPS